MLSLLRFIIIDDDSTNNFVYKIIIRKFFKDAEIMSFLLPLEGLEFIEMEYSVQRIETILFLDIDMPLINGWEFLERFRIFNNSIKDNFKIFILSSSLNIIDLEQAESNPLVKGFINKPLSKEFLTYLKSEIEGTEEDLQFSNKSYYRIKT